MGLEEILKNINNDIISKQAKIDIKVKDIQDKNQENKKLEEMTKNNIKKELLIQEVCDEARKTAKESFESMITNGLNYIFGSHVKAQLITGKKKEIPVMDFKIKTDYDDYDTITDPDEDAGGVADIMSLSIFLCMNILSPENNAPLFLDEPTKYVSAGLATKVAEFIKSISHDYNKQIIMVTHALDTQYSADNVYTVKIDENGASHVSKELIKNKPD